MLLAVDIGNTNIVSALFDGERIISPFRIQSDADSIMQSYSDELSDYLSGFSVDRAVISSVVPCLTGRIRDALSSALGLEPLIVSKDLETGLRKASIPDELGSDLICNLAYAHAIVPDRTAMVVDFGTALTMTAVNGRGEVLGASIAPGLITAMNSLFGETAQLPRVSLEVPRSAFGRNSEDAIRSGIMLGYAGLVSSMIERCEKEAGEAFHVIATGGLSSVIASLIPRFDSVDMNHTLKGLRLIADLN